MANRVTAFFPEYSATIAATTASAGVAVNKDGDCIRIYNYGPNDVCVRFGMTAATAVTTDMRIAAGNTEVFGKGKADYIAAICETGTAAVYLTTGQGM